MFLITFNYLIKIYFLGKLMSSEKDNDSDYDVKVVVQYTIKDYLLRYK